MRALDLEIGRISLLLGLVLAVGVSRGAMALDTGCQPAASVKQQMAAEQQFALVSGDGLTPDRPKEIFTSNERGSMGYLLSQSEPATICVQAKYTDIKVNTTDDFSRPSWANFDATSAYNKWLTTHEAAGEKVLLGATSIIHHAETNTDTKGSFIIVSVGPAPKAIKRSDIINIGGGQLVGRDGEGQALSAMLNVSTVEPNYKKFATREAGIAAPKR